MATRDVEFRRSLERNFSGIGCTLEGKTSDSNLTCTIIFLLAIKKTPLLEWTSLYRILVNHCALRVLREKIRHFPYHLESGLIFFTVNWNPVASAPIRPVWAFIYFLGLKKYLRLYLASYYCVVCYFSREMCETTPGLWAVHRSPSRGIKKIVKLMKEIIIQRLSWLSYE